MNLAYPLEKRAKESPDVVGLIYEDGREFTFREIDEMSSRAGNLMKRLGIKPRDRVGIYLQNSPTFVVLMFGLWKIGAAMVTVNIMYQEEELRHAFQSTDVSIVFTHSRYVAPLLNIRDTVKAIVLEGFSDALAVENIIDYDKEVLKEDVTCPAFVPSDEDVAAILLTGGTTGEPKAVITTHNGWSKTLSDLIHAHAGFRDLPRIDPKSEVPINIVAFPLFHGGGQQSLLFAYCVGRTVLMMERFRVDKYVDLVAKYKVRSLVLFPTMVYDLVNYEGRVDLSNVKSLTIGGEPPPLIRKRFEEKYKMPILHIYGSTEAGHVAGWTVKEVKKGLWKPGSAGKIYDGVEVEIRDENEKRLGPGEVGEICVKNKVTVEGYAGKKDDSKQLIKDGWIYTGDVGYLDEDQVLFLVGRKREMIKCGGFQVWPLEIEEVLSKHPKIMEVAVLGVPDKRMGEIPKAYIVLKEPVHSESEEKKMSEDITEYCRNNLAHFKVIRAIKFVDDIPKADTGKVLKQKLKEAEA